MFHVTIGFCISTARKKMEAHWRKNTQESRSIAVFKYKVTLSISNLFGGYDIGTCGTRAQLRGAGTPKADRNAVIAWSGDSHYCEILSRRGTVEYFAIGWLNKRNLLNTFLDDRLITWTVYFKDFQLGMLYNSVHKERRTLSKWSNGYLMKLKSVWWA